MGEPTLTTGNEAELPDKSAYTKSQNLLFEQRLAQGATENTPAQNRAQAIVDRKQELEEAIEADEISEEDAEREREAIEALDVEGSEA